MAGHVEGGGEERDHPAVGAQDAGAHWITPNYIAQCMGGGVECQGRGEPLVSLSLSLFLASLSPLSLSPTQTPTLNVTIQPSALKMQLLLLLLLY